MKMLGEVKVVTDHFHHFLIDDITSVNMVGIMVIMVVGLLIDQMTSVNKADGGVICLPMNIHPGTER